MKYLFVFLLSFTSLFRGFAQEEVLDRPLSFQADSIGFGQLIDSLSLRFNISFSYDASLISSDSILSVHADSVKLGDWLRSVISHDEVQLYELERQVVIAREPARMPDESIRISGNVTDVNDHKPLAMVNIGVEGETIGTATNMEGDFDLFLPSRFAGRNLTFSSLGYLRKVVVIPPRDTTLTIGLDQTVIQLPEVLVRYVKPSLIMAEVVRLRDKNYASEPTILTAFFREIIQQDKRYVDVSEAVIEIYKPPYSLDWEPERVRFVKGRKGGETEDMDVINFKLQGGPYLFSQVDIIRTGGFLPDEKGQSVYQYSFNGVDYEQGRMVYIIGFEPFNDTGELLYEGEIRVEQNSFAVTGATFQMTRNTIRKSRDYLIRRDSRRFRTRPYFAKYSIDYRPVNDIWMLNSVRGEVSMKIVDKERRVRSDFNTVSEMLVTESRPGNRQKFRWADSFKSNYILSEEIDSYDPDFWSHYNIIRPNESIREVFNTKQ